MVTPDQVEYYREHGYLVVEHVFTREECEELNQYAYEVASGTIPLTPGNGIWMEQAAVDKGLVKGNSPEYLFKIGHQMHMNDPVFQKYAVHPRLVEVLEQVVGPDVKCVQSMYLDKPPNVGVGQPYHQDSWYLKADPDTLLAVWVACDDADPDNGCLYVIPGSHRDPIFPHERPVNPEQQRVYVEVHNARSRPEQMVPLKTGSAVFFAGHVLHRSGNNYTSRRRRAYVLHYADAQSRWLNNLTAKNPFLLVCGREYEGGL